MQFQINTVEFVILVTAALAFTGFRYRKDVRLWIGRGGIGLDTRAQGLPKIEAKPKRRRKRPKRLSTSD